MVYYPDVLEVLMDNGPTKIEKLLFLLNNKSITEYIINLFISKKYENVFKELKIINKYLDEENVESYLISLDTFSKIENKINFLKFKNEISEEECEFFKNNLQFITNREIYEAVLDKKCLTNLGRFNY